MRNIILLAIITLQGCVGIGVSITETEDKTERNLGRSKHDMLSSYTYRTEPKVESNANNEIVMTYTLSPEWCGPFIFIIPVMLPVCSQSEMYIFQDYKLIKHVSKRVKYNGLMCSILPTTYDACVVH
jgi:hypothetical protein